MVYCLLFIVDGLSFIVYRLSFIVEARLVRPNMAQTTDFSDYKDFNLYRFV